MRRSHNILFAFLACALLFVPWLGDTYFYTKGEPREAIVAVSMLQSGDWVLPVSQGADIPYKPPLLAWCIAVLSALLNGGVVTEFLSRLPSALAASAMLTATFAMVRRHKGTTMAWMTMLVCATMFEVFRAAVACRVDMLLTACMVGGIYAMYGMPKRPWLALVAVFLLSGATLTKGPVGSLLPCLCMGIYMLVERRNFVRTVLSLTGICLASFALPALWYYLAWRQGGDAFLDLAFEENIGRLTGTMGYQSHVNPWYYNIMSMAGGTLPWTVPLLVSLCFKRVRSTFGQIRHLRGWPLLCLVCALTVFVFYCFPSSKRAVYLLPCYPFVAYFVAAAVRRIGGTRFMHGWCYFIGSVAIVAAAVFVGVNLGWIHIKALSPVGAWQWIPALGTALVAGCIFVSRRARILGAATAAVLTYLLVAAYLGSYMPMALNSRSDIGAARRIDERVPRGAAIYGVIPNDSLLRYYNMNFYLRDRILTAQTVDQVPDTAWLVSPLTDSLRPAPEVLTRRSADTRGPVLLSPPRKRQ